MAMMGPDSTIVENRPPPLSEDDQKTEEGME